MKIYKLRNCVLNTLERRVIKNGKYVELTPKTFDVLQLLVERSGEIVSKDEFLRVIWNGSFVEEGNLCVYIWKLRHFLAEPSGERYIETVNSIGYRFVSKVELVSEHEWEKQLPSNFQNINDSAEESYSWEITIHIWT